MSYIKLDSLGPVTLFIGKPGAIIRQITHWMPGEYLFSLIMNPEIDKHYKDLPQTLEIFVRGLPGQTKKKIITTQSLEALDAFVAVCMALGIPGEVVWVDTDRRGMPMHRRYDLKQVIEFREMGFDPR